MGDVVQKRQIISKEEIDGLGRDLTLSISKTSDQIVKSMTISRFDDFGDVLIKVKNTAEKLDPKKQFSGVTGWIRSKFVDIKSYLISEFATAATAFDQLDKEIQKHIDSHEQWIKNLDLIFEENRDNYLNIVNIISQAENFKICLQDNLNSFTKILHNDPDALMKAQDKADLESLINRIDIKIDLFKRLKQLCENNAPKIRSQQRTSETNQRVLSDIIGFTIPVIKQEFALYLNSIDNKKTQQLIGNTKVFLQTVLIKSADSASEAAIEASKNLNSPILDNPTLSHIREKILFTVDQIKDIEAKYSEQRANDSNLMLEETRKFIKQLSN